MKHLQRVAQLVFDTPLAIVPAKLEAILAAIGPRLGIEIPVEANLSQLQQADRKSYEVTQDGVACIPIQGTLMKQTRGLWAMSGCSSYETIGMQMQECAADSEVRAILLDIDSPGGETHGCFELSDLIYSMRGQKPIFAVANDAAFSAAYALASAADRIFVTRTGGVGSIGVYALHVDQSDADEKIGLKYTFIFAGDKKIDGNPHEPLSRSAKSDCQKEVDREYDIFCETVARNRGVAVGKITATQAGVMFADNSMPLLADEVGTFEDAMAALVNEIDGGAQFASAPRRVAGANLKDVGKEVTAAAIAATKEGTAMAQKDEQDELAIAAKKGEDADDYMEDGKKGKKADDAEESKKGEDAKKGEDSKKSKKAKSKSEPDEEDEDNEDEEDDDEKKKEGKKATSDAVRIACLCTLAGKPELAAKYITKGFSVTQVETKLLELRAAASAEHDVQPYFGVASTGSMESIDQQARTLSRSTGVSLAKAYMQVCSANPQLYQDYCESREDAMLTTRSRREYIGKLAAHFAAQGRGTTQFVRQDRLPAGQR